jgi:hypothetical protein
MNEEPETRDGQLNIMVHGAEVFGLDLDKPELDDRNFKLTFLPYKTERRLSEFDGVITFQRLYERFKSKSNYFDAWTEHSCDRDELDKREKEADLLVAKGGFIVFLLHKPFKDRISQDRMSIDCTDSDLSKRYLNWTRLHRKDSHKRYASLRCVRDEFRGFIELYGAAWSSFSYYGDMPWRDIALLGREPVGMIIADSLFFIPSLLPEKGSERKEEFYRLLSDAVVTCVKKLRIELPAWADSFILPSEQTLLDEQRNLSARLDEIEKERSILTKFKRVLVGDGDSLVEAVVFLLTAGLGYKVDSEDSYREDLKIVNDEGNPVVFGEVKGTTRGVKREFINQADSHRERAGLASDFPTVLILNTHTKNTRTIEEKDQEVPSEQVKHAVAMRVLVIRTLDLLNLLVLVQRKEISAEDILGILGREVGWLHVLEGKIEIHKE